MNPFKSICLVALFGCALIMPAAQAASISLTPAASTVPLTDGNVNLELFMDFTGDPTIGGGIDLAFSGPISFGGFTPSVYFNSLDPFFTGHGTADADADYEIHFGDFAGLGGINKLGDFTVNLLGDGLGQIDIAINSTLGDFFDINSQVQNVELIGADVNVVPVPAAMWLFGSALGLLGGWGRLRKSAA